MEMDIDIDMSKDKNIKIEGYDDDVYCRRRGDGGRPPEGESLYDA